MARVAAAGAPHHITQRGNNRQDVFLLDDDRRFYLQTLHERSHRHGVTLLGYCLMTNHVHLVAIPEQPDSLARALGQCHLRYAQGFNRRYGHTGHLWQNHFYSCPLGRTHLMAGAALRGPKPGSRRAGRASRGIFVVERAGPCRASRSIGNARVGNLGRDLPLERLERDADRWSGRGRRD